ncbi:hypothetical protein Nepgr_003425 [Nepenthes gracilis]|uniref:Uncharacterized protein n=1 Tax=Nepenthes gracilis TaxID=150966 RepID=A0AAD3RZH1_NEPGR|nr:hypothetical protein Nepgr_003425 [Nepenthes gracilis]
MRHSPMEASVFGPVQERRRTSKKMTSSGDCVKNLDSLVGTSRRNERDSESASSMGCRDGVRRPRFQKPHEAPAQSSETEGLAVPWTKG